jgi:hypothetical protein
VFQPDPAPVKKLPVAKRERPRGAFGDEFPQMVPSTPESAAVKDKGCAALPGAGGGVV